MKRLFLGLVLLTMAFLSTLEALDGVQRLLARAGGARWMVEAPLAAIVVALFVRLTHLHRRMLFPRRGLRLLLAGIAMYALAIAVAANLPTRAAALLPEQADVLQWSAMLRPLPLFVVAHLLLLVGAFRALTNLVPPEEFLADF